MRNSIGGLQIENPKREISNGTPKKGDPKHWNPNKRAPNGDLNRETPKLELQNGNPKRGTPKNANPNRENPKGGTPKGKP